jgi:hypothetical protein
MTIKAPNISSAAQDLLPVWDSGFGPDPSITATVRFLLSPSGSPSKEPLISGRHQYQHTPDGAGILIKNKKRIRITPRERTTAILTMVLKMVASLWGYVPQKYFTTITKNGRIDCGVTSVLMTGIGFIFNIKVWAIFLLRFSLTGKAQTGAGRYRNQQQKNQP